ncbi:LacI family DNA-binding transcriptional regulator [Actinomyces sp. B33]|uniref:LacI family DNA-binding transcriptional regulator n=1 Tax=Actinomyces sp. B33 TaxID=2942131 RepID=UPI00234135B9|nr:LacI family DNA-binding transcriptional regulator [Actinomyces sp. B33]MDC4233827.1 LacI family DNA-binding transcriptional regulator [Actinomyces sp. B33]
MMDVAALAGVSHQTVSRVLNGTGKVAPQTRERVQAAIDQLGYRRNSVARALVTRKSGIIGIVTTTSVHYGPTSILVAIELASRQAGYFTGVTALEDFSVESLTSAFDHFLGLAVEAIVVIAPVVGIAEAVEAVRVPVPVVAVTAADVVGASDIRSVRVDQLGGAREAVRHLVDLGHRDIVHIAGPEDWFEARIRLDGWRVELEAAGVGGRVAPVRGWEASVGYEAGRALVDEGLPTAVFTANDAIALGLIRALDEAGVDVPGDVSIVGFDDEPMSRYFRPGLTTVRQDFFDLGQQVLSAVSSAIEGEGECFPILRPTELIVRDSTAAPRTLVPSV